MMRIPNPSLLTPRYHEVASDSAESGLIKSCGVLIVNWRSSTLRYAINAATCLSVPYGLVKEEG
jgi:hypothetical protein